MEMSRIGMSIDPVNVAPKASRWLAMQPVFRMARTSDGEKFLFLLMLLLFSILLLTIGIRWNTTEVESLKQVAVLLPGSVEFFSIEKAAMRLEAQARSMNLVIFNAGWDPYEQIHQLEKVLSMNFDAIALASVDNIALMAVPTLMEGRQVPLVTFTNGIGHDPYGRITGVRAHVGRDDIKAGQMLGEAIEQLSLEEPPRIFFIQGAPGTAPQRFREEGFRSVLVRNPQWTMVENVLIPAWSPARVEQEVQRVLDSQIEINVIAAQWAGAAVAVANVLKNNERTEVKLVSLEFTRALQGLFQEGALQFASNSSIAEEGRRTIDTVAKLIEHQDVPTFVEVKQTKVSSLEARQISPEW